MARETLSNYLSGESQYIHPNSLLLKCNIDKEKDNNQIAQSASDPQILKMLIKNNKYISKFVFDKFSEIFQQTIDRLIDKLRIQKSENDKLIDDDATKFIVIQRKIEKMIVDEYTKKAVNEQKRQEDEDVHTTFNTFNQDFAHLFQLDSSIKEKIEGQSGIPQSKNINPQMPYQYTLEALHRILNMFEKEELVFSQTTKIHDILLQNNVLRDANANIGNNGIFNNESSLFTNCL